MSRLWLAAPLLVLPLAQPAFAAPQAGAAAPASAPAPAVPAKTDNAAIAEELFKQGLALMEQSKFAEACPKFEGSNKAAWAPGTTINLADCYEKVGRLASAWAKFLECEPHFRKRNPPDERADIAKQRAEALYPRLSRVNIEVPAESKLAGLVIKRDGEPVDETQWGTGLPVDPGKHVIEVSAPGKKAWQWEADVGAGGATVAVKIPVLENAPVEVVGPGPAPDGGMPTQKKIAIGVGAAGVVGLALGGVFGGLTLGKVGDADKSCTKGGDGSFACDAAGVKARDDAKGMATISTVGLVAGGVLAAGGIVLWLTAPSGSAPTTDTKDAAKAARVWIAPVFGQTTGLAAGARF